MRSKIVVMLMLSILSLPVFSFAEDEAKVKEVISGDSMILDSGEIVKLIGVSMPKDMDEPKRDYFMKASKEFSERAIKDNGRSVRLEYCERKRDEFNNVLAYVYIDNLLLNAELIKMGLYDISADFYDKKYLEIYDSARSEAKNQKRGIWADLNVQKEKYTGAVVGNNRNRKYHKYDCRYVVLINDSNKKKFKDQDEAISAGYTPCSFCRPDKKVVNCIPTEGEGDEK